MPDIEVNWDVFISHAHEDAETVARPLKEAFQAAGLQTWLDSEQLMPGDSLRSNIDRGLAKSRFAVVILSQAYFAKDWPQRELNGLATLESVDRKVLLPVWHGITHADIVRHSPMLADRIGISTGEGIELIARKLVQTIAAGKSGPAGSASADRVQPPLECLSLADPSALIGKFAGPYRLEKFLGKGGTGAVFCARHPATGREVAVKLFHPLRSGFEQFAVLFRKAFRAIAALDHPHIVKVFDVSDCRVDHLDSFYLVMEYIEGLHLRDWSARLGADQTAFSKRLAAAIQLAGALHAAHETFYLDEYGLQIRGVLHGDIKPSNVLVTESGEVKLLDFLLLDVQQLQAPHGPARLKPKRSQSTVVPQEDTTCGLGTVGFMPPEQMEKGQLTVQSDVYALGITLCHLFCPDDPDPHLAYHGARDLPQRLKNLLSAMLSSSPKRRPGSADQIAIELTKLTKSGPRERGWLRRLLVRFAS